jgi:hypothetical protein
MERAFEQAATNACSKQELKRCISKRDGMRTSRRSLWPRRAGEYVVSAQCPHPAGDRRMLKKCCKQTPAPCCFKEHQADALLRRTGVKNRSEVQTSHWGALTHTGKYPHQLSPISTPIENCVETCPTLSDALRYQAFRPPFDRVDPYYVYVGDRTRCCDVTDVRYSLIFAMTERTSDRSWSHPYSGRNWKALNKTSFGKKGNRRFGRSRGHIIENKLVKRKEKNRRRSR